MCCSSTPAPDPNVGASQKALSDLAVRQQDWYESNIAPRVMGQLDQSLGIAKQQADKSGQLADAQIEQSRKFSDRYWSAQVPLEDDLIAKARAYNTDAEQERMAAQAGADVEQASDAGRGQMLRGLRGLGINLGSAAAVSAMADMQTQSALAKAGAVNKTREAARQLGWTRMGEAAALGRNLPSFGSTSAGMATGAGNAAVSAGNAGLAGLNTATAGYTGVTNSTAGMLGTSGQLANSLYNTQVSAAANESAGASAGIGSLLGAAISYY